MKQWDVNWGLYRSRIVFADSSDAFNDGIADLLLDADRMLLCGEGRYAIELLTEILIDLNSMLTRWTLDKNVSPEIKVQGADMIRDTILKHGGHEYLVSADAEIESIRKSQFARITESTCNGERYTYWGNDLCTGVDFSLRRGASYTTSNPSKINLFRKSEPAQYEKYLKEVMTEHDGLTKVQILSYLTVKVVSQVARKLIPINRATEGRFGVSFTQVDPSTWDDSDAMIAEVRLWYAEFQKELCTDTPNVVFKLPATPAARIAAEELLKDRRIRVTFTSNFAVGQHKPFLDLIDKRIPNCFLVFVDCHLRRFAKPEFESLGISNPDYYCEKLVHAVYQKCYQQLLEHKSVAMINGAGLREEVGINLCLTDKKECPTTLTVTPTLVTDYDSKERCQEIIWDKPISDSDLEVLNQSSIFRRAYYAEEFPWNDIQNFEPYKFMMDGFMTARQECLDAMSEYEGGLR